MAEFVAGIIDRIRTVSLHQWLAKLVLAIAGGALIAVCTVATGVTLAGVTPVASSLLLLTVVIWPEAFGTIAFFGLTTVWWLLAWHGSLWATVGVAVLVGLIHVITGLASGPGHSVIRLAVVRFLGLRLALYLLVTASVGAVIVALAGVPSARPVAWIAVIVIVVATLVATLVASVAEEAGQVQPDLFDDEPYVRDDFS